MYCTINSTVLSAVKKRKEGEKPDGEEPGLHEASQLTWEESAYIRKITNCGTQQSKTSGDAQRGHPDVERGRPPCIAVDVGTIIIMNPIYVYKRIWNQVKP